MKKERDRLSLKNFQPKRGGESEAFTELKMVYNIYRCIIRIRRKSKLFCCSEGQSVGKEVEEMILQADTTEH